MVTPHQHDNRNVYIHWFPRKTIRPFCHGRFKSTVPVPCKHIRSHLISSRSHPVPFFKGHKGTKVRNIGCLPTSGGRRSGESPTQCPRLLFAEHFTANRLSCGPTCYRYDKHDLLPYEIHFIDNGKGVGIFVTKTLPVLYTGFYL